MARPSFAVGGPGKQMVQRPVPGPRLRVGEERLHGLGPGWHPGDHEGRPPQQGAPVGARGGDQPLRLEPGVDEGVDRPCRVSGNGPFSERLETPWISDCRFARGFRWPGGAPRDPFPKRTDFPGGQRLAGRHARFGIGRENRQQAAFSGFSRHDHRAGVAALHGALAGVEAQAAMLFFRPMAALAPLREQGAHMALESVIGAPGHRRAQGEDDGQPRLAHGDVVSKWIPRSLNP